MRPQLVDFKALAADDAGMTRAAMDGTIKWFNADRRYGFIEPADGGGDIYFDDRALAPELRAAPLEPGDAVVFEVVDGPRGPEASSVSGIVGPGAPTAP